MNIPVFRPSVNVEGALGLLRQTLTSGWLGMGPRVQEFEELIKEVIPAKHFIATSSGTAALHLAVRTLGLQPGDKVLSSPITFISGNAVLLYEGLVPLFGRVHSRSGNLVGTLGFDDLAGVRAAIVTHIGGFPCDMRNIDLATERYGVPVIEDCAHALGSRYANGKLVGDTDNTCCWSFHAVKNLAAGDGGGISTNDDELAERLRRLRWMGISKSTHARSSGAYVTDYKIPEIGFKYHMNDVSACVALANLETLEDDNQRRLMIANEYMRQLRCGLPSYSGRLEYSSCHFVPVFVDDPAAYAAQLADRGIATSRHYKPNSVYRGMRDRFLWTDAHASDSAFKYYNHALVLPLFPGMTDEEWMYVIENFNEVKL